MSYDELKRLAEAATPGPWVADNSRNEGSINAMSRHIGMVSMYARVREDIPQNFANQAFIAAANPSAILPLIAELEKVKADRKACWEEFKAQGRQLDLVKDEGSKLRQDARRWSCVRNAIPMQSPYAVWREGSHLVLGKDADDLVDNFLLQSKEAGRD